jgi:hypothetical protein
LAALSLIAGRKLTKNVAVHRCSALVAGSVE